MEKTFVMVKPDGVQRGLIGEVIARLERRGLKMTAAKCMQVSQELAETHYGIHKGKPFYDGLISYITSAPVMAMVWEGPNAVAAVRQTVSFSAAVHSLFRTDDSHACARTGIHFRAVLPSSIVPLDEARTRLLGGNMSRTRLYQAAGRCPGPPCPVDPETMATPQWVRAHHMSGNGPFLQVLAELAQRDPADHSTVHGEWPLFQSALPRRRCQTTGLEQSCPFAVHCSRYGRSSSLGGLAEHSFDTERHRVGI